MELKLPSGRVAAAPDVADALELPSSALVEKDYHVVRALKAISSVENEDYRLIFAGGTALARAHRFTQRMSEDIDIKMVPIEGRPNNSTARRALRQSVVAALTAEGFAFGEPHVRNEGKYIQIVLPYPQIMPQVAALRPEIQIELTLAALRLPPTDLPIGSFAAEAYRETPEIASFPCCSVTETAAEKVVSLTRRIASDLESPGRIEFDQTLVRHLYDLHVLQTNFTKADVSAMAAAIAIQDAEQFKNQYPGYFANPKARTAAALDALATEQRFRDQYQAFLTEMVYGHRPPYDDALVVLKDLVEGMWP